MPLTHLHRLPVHHYECDVHGRLKEANYLHLMEVAAFAASVAAGYDQAGYAAMQRLWLIRETNIHYRTALRAGETAQIETWVADFRRVRSRRAYALRRQSTGELVAQAHTDWVFLDSTTGRPATIPPEMIRAFFPEGPPGRALPRESFPAQPSPPPGAFSVIRPVGWRDLDPAQHVNNAAYVAYMEDIAWQAAASYGWTVGRLSSLGITMTTLHHRVEYLQPALPHEDLQITTWLSGTEIDTALRHTTFRRASDGALLARAQSRWGCVEVAGDQRVSLPRELLADMAPCVALAKL